MAIFPLIKYFLSISMREYQYKHIFIKVFEFINKLKEHATHKYKNRWKFVPEMAKKKRYVKDWVLPSGQELMSDGFEGTIWSEVCKRLQKQVCSG